METYSAFITRQRLPTIAPEVFLSLSVEGWKFPTFEPLSDIYNTNAQLANQLVKGQIGLSVVTRQTLRLAESTLKGALNIYVMEVRSSREENTPRPTQKGDWFGPDQLSEMSFALPQEKATLEAWLAEMHGTSTPSLHLSWWQPGWFDTTANELQTWVASLNEKIRGPVEQVRSAPTSAIVCVPTDSGSFYLKVVPPFFSQEIAVTQALATYAPSHVPQIVSATKDSMLLRNMGDYSPLGSHISLARWEDVLRFYAQLQKSCVNSVFQFLSLGCIDIRLERIAVGLDRLIDQIPEHLSGLEQQLTQDELARLRALTPRLRELCDELAVIGVPNTLDHGDLHVGNVALRAQDFTIYDWSHACITHPFYGFGSLLLDDDWFANQPEAIPRLRDAYLETWTQYAPLSRLQTAFELWCRLRPLFLAAHQSLVVEAHQDLLEGRPYVPQTATGNALQNMQWWLASHWRNLLSSCETT